MNLPTEKGKKWLFSFRSKNGGCPIMAHYGPLPIMAPYYGPIMAAYYDAHYDAL